jgi:hypothetical protein
VKKTIHKNRGEKSEVTIRSGETDRLKIEKKEKEMHA